MDKDRSLVRIIEVENPASALIFCNTKVRVNYVTTVLQRFGYDADDLTSDLAQAAREKVMERVRKGTLRFLVATDVAARGIDLPELSHVIQYEPPEDSEAYIHRAGRTGRAGGSGTAISLVNAVELGGLAAHRQAASPFNIQERPLPTDEDVEKIVSERIITLLEARLRNRDRLQTERMQRFLPAGAQPGRKRRRAAACWPCCWTISTRRPSTPRLFRRKGKSRSAASHCRRLRVGINRKDVHVIAIAGSSARGILQTLND